MSLLMDALKKAEQEKKEAAKRRTGQHSVLQTGEYDVEQDHTIGGTTDTHDIPVEDTGEFSLALEPLGVTQEQDLDVTQRTILEQQQLNEEGIPDDELTREMDSDLTGSMTYEDTREFTRELSEDSSTAFSLEENTEEFLRLSEEEKTRALAVDQEDNQEKSYANTLEENRQQSELTDIDAKSFSYFDESLDGVSATQLVRDLGQFDGQPTPVAASTVFAASKGTNWGNKVKVGLSITLILLLLITGGLIIHYQTTPSVPNVPSPMVAKGIDASGSGKIGHLDSETTTGSTIKQPEEIESSEEPVITTKYIEHSDEPFIASSKEYGPLYDENAPRHDINLSNITQAEVEAGVSIASTVEPTAGESDAVVAAVETATDKEPMIDVDDVEMETVAEEIITAPVVTSPVTPAMIKISRTVKEKPEVSINKQAYMAYGNGDYDKAVFLYQKSLKETPDNRDALLGLAAINLLRNNPQTAYTLYKKVLQLNPKDVSARVAIVNLQSNANISSNESLLKLLIKDSPDAADLYFSLGNLYARQSRWPEAQQAFFEAYTRSSNNADYAMNLAVSLDHMGQNKAALNYYNAALDLADNKRTSFNPTAVLTRIKALTDES